MIQVAVAPPGRAWNFESKAWLWGDQQVMDATCPGWNDRVLVRAQVGHPANLRIMGHLLLTERRLIIIWRGPMRRPEHAVEIPIEVLVDVRSESNRRLPIVIDYRGPNGITSLRLPPYGPRRILHGHGAPGGAAGTLVAGVIVTAHEDSQGTLPDRLVAEADGTVAAQRVALGLDRTADLRLPVDLYVSRWRHVLNPALGAFVGILLLLAPSGPSSAIVDLMGVAILAGSLTWGFGPWIQAWRRGQLRWINSR